MDARQRAHRGEAERGYCGASAPSERGLGFGGQSSPPCRRDGAIFASAPSRGWCCSPTSPWLLPAEAGQNLPPSVLPAYPRCARFFPSAAVCPLQTPLAVRMFYFPNVASACD